jgi:hypothetical protein
MIVMPANNSKGQVHYWAGKYPGRLGWLIGPSGWRNPVPWLPYALDNGAFSAWRDGTEWDEYGFLDLCDSAALGQQAPLWIVVPDVVGDRTGTLALWDVWADKLKGLYGWPLAFAVQDGMSVGDVPANADVVFVGGTKDWKQRTLHAWCANFPRVHVGRVNGYRMLWRCHRNGVESCDGTGWFRGDQSQLRGLERYLEHAAAGKEEPQRLLFADHHSGSDTDATTRARVQQTAPRKPAIREGSELEPERGVEQTARRAMGFTGTG